MQDEYKVSQKYQRDNERYFDNTFKDMNEAKKFIEQKLIKDAGMKIPVIYRLYKNDELIEEFDPVKIDISALLSKDQGGQGKGQAAGFRPTPFNTAPRPAGMPKKWIHDESEDKKDDKKK